MPTPRSRTHHSWPALYVALLLIAGIIPGYRFLSWGLWGVGAVAAAAGLLTVALVGALRSKLTEPALPAVALLTAILVAGLVTGAVARSGHAVIPDPWFGVPLTVAGDVIEQPLTISGKCRFRTAVRMVLTDSTITPASCDIAVTVTVRGSDDPDLLPRFGTRVLLHGVLHPPRPPRNPGEFDAGQYYHVLGISGLFTVRSVQHVGVAGPGKGDPLMERVVIPLRTGLRSHIERSVGGVEGEFLKGLMIGDRGGLPVTVREDFLTAGVAHILAVSGSNVAVVAAALVALLMLVRIPRRWYPVPVSVVLFLYMFIAGAQPSVVRATIMAFVLLAASHRGIRGNGLNAVGLAALVMIGMDPRQIFDAGFTLSFGAVLSIILLYPVTDRWIGMIPGTGRIHGAVRGALRLAAVSAVSAAGTLPLTAVQFGQVSVVGLVANIPVVPVTGWSVILGLMAAVAGLVSTWAASSLGALNALLLAGTLRFVDLCASLPGASLSMHWFEAAYALPLTAALGALYHAGDREQCRFWGILTLAGAACAVWWPPTTIRQEGALHVAIVDVGQGDAILIEHPDGGAVLVDTGPVPSDSRSGIVPFLLRRGIGELDAVVITHPHDDHTGGLRAVCSVFTVRRILRGGSLPGGTLLPWKDDCRLQVVHSLGRSDTLLPRGMNANRASVVLRLVYGRTAFLFAADAEQEEEERMVRVFGGRLRSDVLKVGHHGSAAGTGEALLAAVEPACAVISVGRMNRFGHPAPPTLDRLRARGVRVLRTDENGAVVLATDGDSVRVLTWR